MSTAEEQARQAAEGDPASQLLERLVTRVGGRADAKAVFGDAVERDGVTVIPVARVRWGVGGGSGTGAEGSGAGGGGGVAADPIGYIEITAAGAEFRPMPPSFSGPMLIAAAIAAAVVLRAVARFRR